MLAYSRRMAQEPADFSLTLAILRLSRGWSQDQVARATGLTNSAISEYERGKKVPELRNVRKIVAALGYRLSAIERTEDFLADLRAEGVLEARETEDGDLSLAPVALLPALGPLAAAGAELEEAAPAPLRLRARRVAAQVGQAATGFVLLLFEVLLGRDRASR
jgi:transcriptional regulator with XRE-family HTH domain